MANTGPDTNTAHFSIIMAPSPHLDGHYVVFGEVLTGFDVSRRAIQFFNTLCTDYTLPTNDGCSPIITALSVPC